MILIFVFGYLCIALEHKLRIDKAAIALLMCGALWTVLSLLGNDAQIGTQLIEQHEPKQEKQASKTQLQD